MKDSGSPDGESPPSRREKRRNFRMRVTMLSVAVLLGLAACSRPVVVEQPKPAATVVVPPQQAVIVPPTTQTVVIPQGATVICADGNKAVYSSGVYHCY
jgi:hypothetical protein